MMISYNPETGFSWAETLVGVPNVKPLYEHYGDEGIAYAILFGHPLSPYEYELDQQERETMVLAEITERYRQGKKKKSAFPERFYEKEICTKAISAVIKASCSPNIHRLHRLREREQFYEDQLSKGALSEDKEERQKELAADEKCFKLMGMVRKEIRDEETFISKALSSSGSLSLDMML